MATRLSSASGVLKKIVESSVKPSTSGKLAVAKQSSLTANRVDSSSNLQGTSSVQARDLKASISKSNSLSGPLKPPRSFTSSLLSSNKLSQMIKDKGITAQSAPVLNLGEQVVSSKKMTSGSKVDPLPFSDPALKGVSVSSIRSELLSKNSGSLILTFSPHLSTLKQEMAPQNTKNKSKEAMPLKDIKVGTQASSQVRYMSLENERKALKIIKKRAKSRSKNSSMAHSSSMNNLSDSRESLNSQKSTTSLGRMMGSKLKNAGRKMKEGIQRGLKHFRKDKVHLSSRFHSMPDLNEEEDILPSRSSERRSSH